MICNFINQNKGKFSNLYPNQQTLDLQLNKFEFHIILGWYDVSVESVNHYGDLKIDQSERVNTQIKNRRNIFINSRIWAPPD